MMARTWVLGSSEECDLVIDAPGVSGRHCRLTRDADGRFTLEDLGSLNGTFVNGTRITRPERAAPGDAITLGRVTPVRWPADATETPTVLTLGRDTENDVVIDLPVVSGRHARVRWEPKAGEAWIEDLGSANGISVGVPGLRSQRSRFLPHETIYLGSQAIPAAWLLKRLGLREIPESRRSGTIVEETSPFAHAPLPPPTMMEPAPPAVNVDALAESSASRPFVQRWPVAVLLGQGVAVSVIAAGWLRATGADAAWSAFALSLCACWFGLFTALYDGALRPAWIGRWGSIVPTCLAQSLLAWVVVKFAVGLRGPASSEILLMLLAACASLALGALIVATLRRPGLTLSAALLAIIAMALLARGPSAPRVLADATPTRWAYEGLFLAESDASSAAPREVKLPGVSQPSGPFACVLSLGFMLVGFAGATVFLTSSGFRRSE